MHDGQLAREIAQAAQAEGIGLTVEDLRRQLPRWLPTTTAERGNEIVHTATTPGAAGDRAARRRAPPALSWPTAMATRCLAP